MQPCFPASRPVSRPVFESKIGEDFHSQVVDGKTRTTLYKVRYEGYDKKDNTWEPITHLQGYVTMVKSFKESHAKDLEKFPADRQCQEAKIATETISLTLRSIMSDKKKPNSLHL